MAEMIETWGLIDRDGKLYHYGDENAMKRAVMAYNTGTVAGMLERAPFRAARIGEAADEDANFRACFLAALTGLASYPRPMGTSAGSVAAEAMELADAAKHHLS
jgi:hypothetical protein